jgi:hypothetical protein
MVPLDEMVKPAGSPVAEKVYGPPAPPLPASVTGVIGDPCAALMVTQEVQTGEAVMVMVQLTVPLFPAES